jgi:HlyD family secretion protein
MEPQLPDILTVQLRILLLIGLGYGAMTAQNPGSQSDVEIDKSNISVHRVRHGDMPIRLMPSGEIISLSPPEVAVTVPSGTTPSPQVGQQASVQVKPPDVMIGSVVDMDRATLLDSYKVMIRLKDPFPADATVGERVGSLIEVGELKDVVYFERPASARPNTEMLLFVIEPNGEFARRTMVRFGRQSGGLIQIVSGLSPDDLVIVTDTSRWNSYERLRLK